MGGEEYYEYGHRHRKYDLPAIKNSFYEEYYKKGKLHREGDLPAVVYFNGTEEYYKNGKRHRDNDLPAILNKRDKFSVKSYYKNGIKYKPMQPPIRQPIQNKIQEIKIEKLAKEETNKKVNIVPNRTDFDKNLLIILTIFEILKYIKK